MKGFDSNFIDELKQRGVKNVLFNESIDIFNIIILDIVIKKG